MKLQQHNSLRLVLMLALFTGIGLIFFPHVYAVLAQNSQWVESDDARIIRGGGWHTVSNAAASGGSYLSSGGDLDDTLFLQFRGTRFELVYVADTTFATLAIEIDGIVVRTISTTSHTAQFDRRVVIDYLSDSDHFVRIYGVEGSVAIDAFIVEEILSDRRTLSSPNTGGLSPAVGVDEGVLTLIYGDEINANGEMVHSDQFAVLLTDALGETYELENVAYKTAQVLNGQWVEVVSKGQSDDGAGLDVAFVRPSYSGMGNDESSGGVRLDGSQAWITILCKFPDIAGEPNTPAWYQGMYSSSYPGLDHYWQQVSYGNINLAGSGVVSRWYTLPKKHADYFSNGNINLTPLMNDCTKAADGEVNFSRYVGVNMAFNAPLGCCAWGGSAKLALDGVSRNYRVTWLPSNGQTFDFIAHEMGHGFNFPHSSGPADNLPKDMSVYVSKWDVMSIAKGTCAKSATYGCLAPGTNAYNASLNNWIPPERIITIPDGEVVEVVLERALTPSGTGYLVAFIPIKNLRDVLYVVEVRDPAASYDQNVPGKAVIIYKVNRLGNGNAGPAAIVDADGNNDVNDAGAMWLPGETFTDHANKVQIKVLAASGTGYRVKISNTIRPEGVSPQGRLSDGDPIYQWKVFPDATWYEVAILGTDGKTLYSQWHQASELCSRELCSLNKGAILTQNGVHRWAVRAYGPTIDTTNWSSTLQFELSAGLVVVPTQSGPTNNILTRAEATYEWSAAANATWYQLRVLQAGKVVYSGWVRAKDACNGGLCYSEPTFSLKTGAYQWTIQGWNPSGMGPMPPAKSFEVVVSPPADSPILVAPSGAGGARNPTFIWQRVSSTTHYQLYINGPNGVILNERVAANVCDASICSVTKSLNLNVGDYQFWVQPINQFGAGTWSNGLRFSYALSALATTEFFAPLGTVDSDSPTFIWSHQAKVEWYRVIVRDAKGLSIYDKWFQSSALCDSQRCSTMLEHTFTMGENYRWYVQAWSAESGVGLWNGPRYFNLTGRKGFSTVFDEQGQDWQAYTGTWTASNGYYHNAANTAGTWETMSYQDVSYSNFDYQVRFAQTDCTGCYTALLLRGTPQPIAPEDGRWASGYRFEVNAQGLYRVLRMEAGGSEVILQNWASTDALQRGTNWNVLRVVADGSNFAFYANETLIWSGTDRRLASGLVGIGTYNPAGTAHVLYLHSANLTVLAAR